MATAQPSAGHYRLLPSSAFATSFLVLAVADDVPMKSPARVLESVDVCVWRTICLGEDENWGGRGRARRGEHPTLVEQL